MNGVHLIKINQKIYRYIRDGEFTELVNLALRLGGCHLRSGERLEVQLEPKRRKGRREKIYFENYR